VCENSALLGHADLLDNDGAEGVEAGWRYEPERLAEEWEPKVEVLNKEEIDRREGDRERQVRRQRRETARFSTSANMGFGTPSNAPSDYFTIPEPTDVEMGRGERIKKKRRFRSISPEGGRGTPDAAGGPLGPLLQEWERPKWRCAHCRVWGTSVWAVREGPKGPRTLCHNCGYFWERDRKLPGWSKGLYATSKSI